MTQEEYYNGRPGRKYGIWNAVEGKWQFGICEKTPALAMAKLHKRIGDDAYRWRFGVKARKITHTKKG